MGANGQLRVGKGHFVPRLLGCEVDLGLFRREKGDRCETVDAAAQASPPSWPEEPAVTSSN